MPSDDAWKRRLEREKSARRQAEAILEQKSLELWEANQELRAAAEQLEARIAARTGELEETMAALEAANKAKSRFLANMSHEIRSPLTAVMGYANLIEGADLPDAECREWSLALQRSAEHLLGLVGDILDLTKIEAGELAINLEPTPILREVAEIMSLFAAAAQTKGISLDLSCEGSVPSEIHCDPLRLRQIVVNLLSNAVKFTSEGGVRVEISAVSHDLGGTLKIAVADTGVGIPADQLDTIFQPFTQSHDASYGGTGLGLDISRRLAMRLDGDLRVTSELGRGSTFTLTLPVTRRDMVSLVDPEHIHATTRVASRVSLPKDALRGRNIFVTDDSKDNRRIIERFLTQAGATVQLATNGQEALDVLLAEDAPEFDIVLMDVRMPVLDGISATRALRAAGYLGTIVALTADATVDARHASLTAGCDEYIVKPIVPRSLLARLDGLLVGGPRTTRSRTARPGRRRATMTSQSFGTPAAKPARSEPSENTSGLPDWLIAEYLETLRERIDELADAMKADDLTRIRSVAHKIAGTGTSYGYPLLSQLGLDLQSAIDEDHGATLIGDLCGELMVECRHVVGG